jgi:hypothetical protein
VATPGVIGVRGNTVRVAVAVFTGGTVGTSRVGDGVHVRVEVTLGVGVPLGLSVGVGVALA